MEIKMKKLFLIFILLLFIATPAFSEDIVNENSDDTTEEFGMIYEPENVEEENIEETSAEDVFLNSSPTEQLNIKKSKKFGTKKYDLSTKEDKNITPQNVYMFQNFDQYSSKSSSYTKQKQHGNFILGTKYDSTYSPDSTSQTNTLFSKYQKNKFSFNTSYKSNSLAPLDQRGKGTLSFSPEYKLNNKISVQNIYSTSFLDKNKKSEIMFSLKPFKDDRMDFNIGASQIYSETSAPTRSQLNFSTKFRF